jgi:putative FmdB family regulatory protein
MPIFEYLCRECDHRFETSVLNAQKSKCPKCESKRLEQQLSSFAVGGDRATARAESAASPGACGSCGDPRGPGAYSMN